MIFGCIDRHPDFSRFANRETAAPQPALPPGFQIHQFARGYIAYHPSVRVHHAGARSYFVLGEPYFATAHDNPAVAWAEADTHSPRSNEAEQPARGRFALVCVDTEAGELRLITDRFGSWPLCYADDDGVVNFSDRADCVPGPQRELSAQAIFDYLYFHTIPGPHTLFAGVQRLPAAHILHATPTGLANTPWWRPRFVEAPAPDLEYSKHRFMTLVEQAVAREANGHDVGCFLSGGTDSSTVAGMLTRVTGSPARAYSIGFDAQGYDEMEYARIAARHFGVEHHEYYVTPDDLLNGIPTVARFYDQPFGNSSAVPAWICASRARADGIEKLLAGDGGDELFGGNARYAKQRVFSWYEQVPAVLRERLLQPLLAQSQLQRLPLVRKGTSYVTQARVPMPDRLQMYNMLDRLGHDNVFTADFLTRINAQAPLQLQRETWNHTAATSLINRMLEWDWKYTLTDNDLPKVVGTTQLAGLTVGFPMLSDELAEFSLGIPPNWKVKGLTLRWFFKEALRGFLPDAIIAKKKHGFGLPFGVWACQHPALRALAVDSLQHFATRGIIQPAFIERLINELLPSHPGYYGEMVWIIMMLELWLAAHADQAFAPHSTQTQSAQAQPT